MVSEPTSVVFIVVDIDMDESVEQSITGRKNSAYHCCVPLCNGDSRYHEDLRFHRIPGRTKDEKLKKEWLVKIRRDEGPDFKITTSTRVCSRHFTKEDYLPPTKSGSQRLKRGAVPSNFNWNSSFKARRKIIRHVDRDTQTDDSDTDGVESEAMQSRESVETEVQSLKAQLLAMHGELEASRKEAAAAKEELRNVKAKATLSKFGLERFGPDNESIKFYTGFPTNEHIKLFFNFIKPSAELMTYCYASGERENRPASRNMLLIDEMFMFLVRLKLGLFEQDLADRFAIHISSVSRKLVTWSNFLYFFLGSQIIWPSRADVDRCMPEGFRELYPSTRVILDCTEIFVQTPTSLLLQSQLYSSYKSNTTLKGLIGITPHGAICFVSTLYTGGISDREITRCSGILDLLEAGDSVMADKGFDIGNMLQEYNVALNIPPFLENQGQFSTQDVQKTKTIASLRIHVERAIRRVKEYHFLDFDVPLSTLGSVNQLYSIACLLTNFQGPLILSK